MSKVKLENSLAYLYPDVASWCKNHEDALYYSAKSREYLDWVCPYCGTDIPHKSISNIVNDGLSCPKCSDKLPYPEKLMMHILCYIHDNYLSWLEIEPQYSPKWCVYIGKDNKRHKGRFDFAIKRNGKILKIIEMDGLYHYIDNEMSGQTAEESQLIDATKDKLSVDNLGIKPIRIDSRESKLDYIKSNILNSEIYKFFLQFKIDLKTDIDWENCERRSLKNVIKRVCDLYNDGLLPIEIVETTGLSNSGVYTYLKKGARAGLCNYPDGREKAKKAQATAEWCSKAVICFNDNKIFKNANEAKNFYTNIKIYQQINAWCKRDKRCTILHPNGKPYDFMYVEDYEKYGYIPYKQPKIPEHYTKPVVCTTTKERFKTIPIAAKEYQIDQQQIWYNCIGKCYSVGKIGDRPLIWVFEEDYDPNKIYEYKGNEGRRGIVKSSRIPIICVNTGKFYDCCKTAKEDTGISDGSINKCVNGNSAYAGLVQETKEPLVWRRVDEYDKNEKIILPKIHKKQRRFVILDNMTIFNSTESFGRYIHIRLDSKEMKEIINKGYGYIKNYQAMTLDYYFEQHPEIQNQIVFYREHVYLDHEQNKKPQGDNNEQSKT